MRSNLPFAPQEQKPRVDIKPKPVIVKPEHVYHKPIKPISTVYSGDKLKLYELLRDADSELVEAMMRAYDKKDFSTKPGFGAPLSYISVRSSNQLYEYIAKEAFTNIKSFIKAHLPTFKGDF